MARPLKKRSTKEIIKIVTAIRKRNNILWMNLMELAIAGKPRKAKSIIHKITANDMLVSKWTGRI